MSLPIVDFPLLLDLDPLLVLSRCGEAALGNAASVTSSGRGLVHESSNEMNPSPVAAELASVPLNAELPRFPDALSGATSSKEESELSNGEL